MSQTEIVCSNCGKKAKINKIDGELCISCWRKARLEKRNKRLRESLDHCLKYYDNTKFSPRELKLIKDATSEINKKRPESAERPKIS